MIDRDEYTVRLMDLPEGVGGFIAESPDGFRNIYINARHGWTGQRKSFRHEMAHAEHDDLHSDEPLEVIEARADGNDVHLQQIPQLMRARDLLPPPPPKPVPKHAPQPLTPYQARVLANCITELDRWLFIDVSYDY